MEGCKGMLVFVEDENIISFAGGMEKAVYGTGCKEGVVDDAFKKLLGIVKYFAGSIA
jgi:hypothetical protein